MKFSRHLAIHDALAKRSQSKEIRYSFRDLEGHRNDLSDSDLYQSALNIAAQLQQTQSHGSRALLLYSGGCEFMKGFLGCLFSGVVAVPTYPPNPSRMNRMLPRILSVIKDSDADCVLVDSQVYADMSSVVELMPELKKLKWIITDEVDQNLHRTWKNPNVSPDDLAFIQYTSGSTGTPKGVMISHGNLVHQCEFMRHASTSDKYQNIGVNWAPMYHDMGLIYGYMLPVYAGFKMIYHSPLQILQDPITWLRTITKEKATITISPNFALDLCARKVTEEDLKTLDLSSLRCITVSAEPVRVETLNRFYETFASCGFRQEAFHSGWGLAETTLATTYTTHMVPPVVGSFELSQFEQGKVVNAGAGQKSAKLVSAGQPRLGTKIEIVHPETNQRLSPGEIGEIWVSSPSNAKGYWKKPEETEKTFQAYLKDSGEGPFIRTGDLGILHEGELFVTGRLKDLIILFGRNYYPQDIEQSTESAKAPVRPGCVAAFSIERNSQEKLVVVAEVERRFKAPKKTDLLKFIEMRVRSLMPGFDPNSPVKFDEEEAVRNIRQAILQNNQVQVDEIVFIVPGTIPKTSSGKIQRKLCKQLFTNSELKIVHHWRQESEEAQALVSKVSAQKSEATERAKEIENTKLEDLCGLIQESPEGERLGIIKKHLQQEVSILLGLETLADARAGLVSLGLDSMLAVQFADKVQKTFGRKLKRKVPATLLYSHPTIEAIANFLLTECFASEPTSVKMQSSHQDISSERNDSFAIVGMSCRFPGADSQEKFWKNLSEAVDATSDIPTERWDRDAFYSEDRQNTQKMYVKRGGFLNQVDQFDAAFFGITPREAKALDPQHRLLLEVGWEAIEDAGISAPKMFGSLTGVFLGISGSDYFNILRNSSESKSLDTHILTGNMFSTAAGRISYLFGFHGPAISIDTACSSSLVALDLACESLKKNECDHALVAGANLTLIPENYVSLSNMNALSPDGKCKTFDQSANGYARSEGCGVLIVKRLSDAQDAGDRILAVVRGTAVNQDGRSGSLTAPNGKAQEAVIQAAILKAKVDPRQISYVEAHGTGTPLGDPVEVEALSKTYGQNRTDDNPLIIGSVKTNIGHTEAAAGLAGVIKVVLAMRNKSIPAHLNLKKLNPHIAALGNLKIKIPTALEKWNPPGARIAAVSSFGFSGTNAHVILEEAVEHATTQPTLKKCSNRSQQIVTLSAQTADALKAQVQNYSQFLATTSSSLEDISYTSTVGRAHFEQRIAVVGGDLKEISVKLAALEANQTASGIVHDQAPVGEEVKVGFLFSGQGSQYVGMAKNLYECEVAFKEALDECALKLNGILDKPLLEIIFKDETLLNQTKYTQPCLFALQYSLCQLWKSWGVEPSSVMGHSVGEYAAATVAGVFSLEDGLKLIAKRGELMQQLTGDGQMIAVQLSEAKAKESIKGLERYISIAAVNGPTSVVLAGYSEQLNSVIEKLKASGVRTKALTVSHAFHSPQMDGMLEEFKAFAEKISYSAPQVSFISNLTGQKVKEEVCSPEYWTRHVREAVNFYQGVRAMQAEDCKVYLEIGPQGTLLAMAQSCVDNSDQYAWVSSLRKDQPDQRQILESLGALYCRGVQVDWDKFHATTPNKKKVKLPTYPFQRQRYWVEGYGTKELFSVDSSEVHPLLGRRFQSALNPDEIHFEKTISPSSPAYLKDHKVFGRIVVPGAMYVELAVAAAQAIAEQKHFEIEDIEIQKALFLDENTEKKLQIIIRAQAGSTFSFQVLSLDNNGPKQCWIAHATGKISIANTEAEALKGAS